MRVKAEIFRHVSEKALSKPAEFLASKKIPPDAITAMALLTGITGVWLLSDKKAIAQRVKELSHGKLNPSSDELRVAGAVALGASFILDLLDGAVARISKDGPTKHGKIFDTVSDKMVDALPAVFILPQSEKLHEKATWLTYLFSAPLPAFIRSIAARHGIEISEIGGGSRLARTSVLVPALIFENIRQPFGKILALQTIGESISRYRKIRQEGNPEAIKNVHEDLIHYTAFFLLSRIGSANNIPRGVLTLGVELAKLTQVKIKEVYRQKQ